MDKGVVIRTISKRDIDKILTIADEEFGAGYLGADKLNQFLHQDKRVALGVYLEGHQAGYALAGVYAIDEFLNGFDDSQRGYLKNLDKHQTIGFRHQTAVNRKYQSRGTGIKLFDATNQWLESKDPDVLVSVVWQKNVTNRVEKLLERNGFVLQEAIPGFWSEDSLSKQYNCQRCGKPPCRCTAKVYLKICS